MRKPKLSKSTIEKLLFKHEAKVGKYEYELTTRWNEEKNTYEDILTRWDEDNDYKEWTLGWQGIYEFEK